MCVSLCVCLFSIILPLCSCVCVQYFHCLIDFFKKTTLFHLWCIYSVRGAYFGGALLHYFVCPVDSLVLGEGVGCDYVSVPLGCVAVQLCTTWAFY